MNLKQKIGLGLVVAGLGSATGSIAYTFHENDEICSRHYTAEVREAGELETKMLNAQSVKYTINDTGKYDAIREDLEKHIADYAAMKERYDELMGMPGVMHNKADFRQEQKSLLWKGMLWVVFGAAFPLFIGEGLLLARKKTEKAAAKDK